MKHQNSAHDVLSAHRIVMEAYALGDDVFLDDFRNAIEYFRENSSARSTLSPRALDVLNIELQYRQ